MNNRIELKSIDWSPDYKIIDYNEIELKPIDWLPDYKIYDYINLLGNPENNIWTPEEENRVDKLFEEIKKLANKMIKDEED